MAGIKHTAGPWRADPFEALSGKYPIRGGKTVHGAPFVIAWVNNPQTARAGEPQANRSLIEAAPDLLAALKSLHAELVRQGINFGPLIADAEAAIARSEGSSHA